MTLEKNHADLMSKILFFLLCCLCFLQTNIIRKSEPVRTQQICVCRKYVQLEYVMVSFTLNIEPPRIVGEMKVSIVSKPQ